MTALGSCTGDTNGGWRCRRCQLLLPEPIDPKENLRPAADGSCGCFPGYYLNKTAAPARKCVLCPKNSWCPGGTESASTYTASGDPGKTDCPTNMVTVNKGARTKLFCVNKPGYSYTAPTSDTAGDPSVAECPENTFSTGYKRQAKCTPCPSGMRTEHGLPDITFVPASALPAKGYSTSYSDGAGTMAQTSAAGCKVPPGWYVTSSNKVIRCPKGEYRSEYVDATATTAHHCLRCPRGTTTYAPASPDFGFCDVLVPGYYWIGPVTRPSGSGPGTEPYTKTCEQKSYCYGGYPTDASDTSPADGKIDCTSGLWTKGIGATSSADCLIPPGHKLASGTVSECSNDPAGEFAPDWRKPGTGADGCTACGSGIKSDKVEPLAVFTLATSGADSGFVAVSPATIMNVAGTSASCYIEQGQGTMLVSSSTMANPVYRAVTCTGNNYGVADKQYELRLSPCKDCPTNMQTNATGKCYPAQPTSYKASSGGFYDPRACCTLQGWGYDGVRAAICAQGTYNPANDEPADKCRDCPPGTTTEATPPTVPSDASSVDALADCQYTQPGYGQTPGNPYTVGDPAGLQQCPIGRYSTGGAVITSSNGNCVPCPLNKTTRIEGATTDAECDVNTFGDISRAGGDFACKDCPGNLASAFNFLVDYNPKTLFVKPVSEAGATSAQQCLLEFAAIQADNWYLPTTDSLSLPQVSSTGDADCMAACGANPLCEFFTYDYGTPTGVTPVVEPACYHRIADQATEVTGLTKVAYKVLPGNGLGDEGRKRLLLAGAAKPKESGSGVFSWFNDDRAHQIGQTIDFVIDTPTISNCLDWCTDEPTCAAVVFTMVSPDYTSLDTSTAKKPCDFKRGVVNVPTSTDYTKRTMVHYRTDAAVAAVRPPVL
ncbi:hypothetical protein OEZ86_010215 [Tetradesmus obliquus]|nr:hypothetical protein OEZ86_010215 [Tetradesmus obliquus]